MDPSNKKSDIFITMQDPEYGTTNGSVMRGWIKDYLIRRHEKKIMRARIKALAEGRDPDPEIRMLDAEFEKKTGIARPGSASKK